MRRRRWSTAAIVVGVALLAGSAAFRLAAVPALVRFPVDVDVTAHYKGTAITYMDSETLLPLATPLREPLTVDRHVKVIGHDFAQALVAETITIHAGTTTNVEHYQYVLDRRTMKFVADPRMYAFGNPANAMHAAGVYRVNFSMNTTADGTYLAYIPEADTSVPLVLVRGPHRHADAGVDVIDFSSKLNTPVAPYYRQHLEAIGLPMEVSTAQLQPQLLAAGIDMGAALRDVGSRLTPDESALLGTTLAKPVPLDYFFIADGVISIEPKTGALIDVHSKKEGIAVQPDMSGASALQPVLDKYSDIPSVKAVSDGLAALAVRTPQPAQMLVYTQTVPSSSEIATTATDQATLMTILNWGVPAALALIGALLLAFGIIGRRRVTRGGPSTPVRDEPPAPVEPPTPDEPQPRVPVTVPGEPVPVGSSGIDRTLEPV